MRFNYFTILVLINALVLPPEWPNIVKPTLFSLKETKLKLLTSLQSLMPQNIPDYNVSISSFSAIDSINNNGPQQNHIDLQTDNSDTTSLMFIPRELINPTMFKTLGLANLFSNWHGFGDNSNGKTSSDLLSKSRWLNLTAFDQLLIPESFKTFFIFNTLGTTTSTSTPTMISPSSTSTFLRNPIIFKKYEKSNNINNFLSKSIPFDMPNLLTLVDYYMVIPQQVQKFHDDHENPLQEVRNLTSSIYHKSLLNVPGEYLPIFRSQLSEMKPMIVFMFNETTSSSTAAAAAAAAGKVSSFAFEDKYGLNHNQEIGNGGGGGSPIISIKNYLSSTSISSFFDKFANIWLKQVDYDSLIHAVYCNVNSQDQKSSYCLKIQNQLIHILPVFKKKLESSKEVKNNNDNGVGYDYTLDMNSIQQNHSTTTRFSKMEETPDTDGNNDQEIQTQAIRQLHDKLRSQKDKTKGVTLGLAHEPKKTIEKIDEKLDDKVDSKFTKIIDTKDSLKIKLDDKKTTVLKHVSSKLDEIDDKTDLLADSVKRKKHQFTTYKLKPRLFEKKKSAITKYEHIGVDETYDDDDEEKEPSLEDCDDIEDENIRKSSIYAVGNDNGDGGGDTKKQYIHKRNQVIESDYSSISLANGIPDEGIIIPLSLLKFEQQDQKQDENLRTLNFPPRHKSFSQIINLQTGQKYRKKRQIPIMDDHDTKDNNKNDKDEPCQPITWYNIFHYSIFGEPKFCNEDN